MKRINWDRQRAAQLLAEGRTSLEIAEMVGASKPAIDSWRAKQRRVFPAGDSGYDEIARELDGPPDKRSDQIVPCPDVEGSGSADGPEREDIPPTPPEILSAETLRKIFGRIAEAFPLASVSFADGTACDRVRLQVTFGADGEPGKAEVTVC